MSPEQAAGSKEVDHRSDLWSLAVIVAECLTGKVVFDASGIGELFVKILTAPIPPLRSLGPHLPQGLESWWNRAMARDPKQRFGSASEFAVALRASGAAFSSGPTLDVRPVAGGVVTVPIAVPTSVPQGSDTAGQGHTPASASVPALQMAGSALRSPAPSHASSGTAPLDAFVSSGQRPSTVEPVSSQPRTKPGSSAGVALRSFAVVLGAIAVVAALIGVSFRLIGQAEPDVAASSELLPEASELSAPGAPPEATPLPTPGVAVSMAEPEPSVEAEPSVAAPSDTSTVDTAPSSAATASKDPVALPPRVNRPPPAPPAPAQPPAPTERSPRQSLERQLGF